MKIMIFVKDVVDCFLMLGVIVEEVFVLMYFDGEFFVVIFLFVNFVIFLFGC